MYYSKAQQILLLIMYSSAALSGVYKWVDDQGRVHYGDQPSDHAKELSVDDKPVNNDSSRREKQQKLLDVIESERMEKKEVRERQKAEKLAMKKKCDDVQKQLQNVLNASFLYQKTDDPNEPHIIDDAEKKAHEAELRQYINKNCK